MFRSGFWIYVLSVALAAHAFGIEVVSELPMNRCEEVRLGKDKEVPLYKDFSLLGFLKIDPVRGEAIRENPLLTTLQGTVHLNRLGPARKLKTLTVLSRLFGTWGKIHANNPMWDSESLFVPVMLCGNDSYHGTLGFLAENSLQWAAFDDYGESELPPSTYPNPIPTPHFKNTQPNS
jgi:hypothetical protein